MYNAAMFLTSSCSRCDRQNSRQMSILTSLLLKFQSFLCVCNHCDVVVISQLITVDYELLFRYKFLFYGSNIVRDKFLSE